MTFSLAGRCAATGMLGAVVTTSSPAVGSRCLFARAKTGVVLTQFWTDPRLGPRGLALMGEGVAAPSALAAVIASTAERHWRQVAMLDAQGAAAHFSGEQVKPHFAGVVGQDCVAIGNILANDSVPSAMVAAFVGDPAQPLPERLLAALDAGLAAGGETKDLVSAGLLVVREAPFPYIDLRVDSAPRPLEALRSLWTEFAPLASPYAQRALDPAQFAIARDNADGAGSGASGGVA